MNHCIVRIRKHGLVGILARIEEPVDVRILTVLDVTEVDVLLVSDGEHFTDGMPRDAIGLRNGILRDPCILKLEDQLDFNFSGHFVGLL